MWYWSKSSPKELCLSPSLSPLCALLVNKKRKKRQKQTGMLHEAFPGYVRLQEERGVRIVTGEDSKMTQTCASGSTHDARRFWWGNSRVTYWKPLKQWFCKIFPFSRLWLFPKATAPGPMWVWSGRGLGVAWWETACIPIFEPKHLLLLILTTHFNLLLVFWQKYNLVLVQI